MAVMAVWEKGGQRDRAKCRIAYPTVGLAFYLLYRSYLLGITTSFTQPPPQQTRPSLLATRVALCVPLSGIHTQHFRPTPTPQPLSDIGVEGSQQLQVHLPPKVELH